MKLLYITYRNVKDKSNGGSQCTNRNYLSFCELIGIENVEIFQLTHESNKSLLYRILKWVNYLFGFEPGLSYSTVKKIIQLANNKDYVFIDSSIYGRIAYYLKKHGYQGKIICFFHNVEYNIALQRLKNPLYFWQPILKRFNERNAIKFSDTVVSLNNRDRNELIKLYNRKEIETIPISLFDTYDIQKQKLTSVPPTLLFIGNNWYPNIHGLKWFIANVLNHVEIKLQVVGTGMDVLKEKFIHPKIEFHGYVSNLSTILADADYVVSPIFKGSGMKVKICEALMFGKNIIGTKESFEGYELDFQKVGAICNSKEEFISSIKDYCSVKREKFNLYSRQCFLDKYSFQATLMKFDELLIK